MVKKETKEKETTNNDVLGICDYLRAGYSHFLVEVVSGEIDWAVGVIKTTLNDHADTKGNKPFTNSFVWACTPPPTSSAEARKQVEQEYNADPLAPIQQLEDAKVNTVGILKNYNWFMQERQSGVPDFALVQYIQDRLAIFRGKQTRKIMIIVTSEPPLDALPKELSREFIPLRLSMPKRVDIEKALDKAVEVGSKIDGFKTPTKKDKSNIVDNAMGMTVQESENSFFYSMAKTKGSIRAEIVKDVRMKYLEDIAGVKYIEYNESLDSLKGYDVVKKFALATLPNPKSKGFMCLGPSGTGKSHLAKALQNALGIPMLTVEMAEWFTSLYGETGHRVRRGIEAILSLENVIVFVDEIEKGLAGTRSGGNMAGQHEGHEETQRAMAQWLKFMNDRPDGVRIIATCNNIFGLPPEYIRAERWDTAPFFIDLPNDEEKQSILDHYKGIYKVDGKLRDWKGWSGAELKSVCRLADIMGTTIDNTEQFIVPVAETMKEEIEYLRTTCKSRTIPASKIQVGNKTFSSVRALDI